MERYSDKALLPKKQRIMDAHLKTCLECRKSLADYTTAKSLFSAAPPPPAPDHLTADIMRKIRGAAADAKNRNEGIIVQWWKETAIPVRLAFSVVCLIFIVAGIFMGKDLWNTPDSKAYPEYTELDVFSETQKGSLEYGYFQLITIPTMRDEK